MKCGAPVPYCVILGRAGYGPPSEMRRCSIADNALRPTRRFVNRTMAAICVLSHLAAVTAGQPSATNEPADRAEPRDALLAELGGDARLRTTPHFRIAYNTDPDVLTEFIARIEGTYKSVERFLGIIELQSALPEKPLQILFFADYNQFHAYAQRTGTNASGAAGYYEPRTNRAAFYDAMTGPRFRQLNTQIDALQEQLSASGTRMHPKAKRARAKQLRSLRIRRDRMIETINQLVVQHEVAHQVLYNAGVHHRKRNDPKWLVEGLACLFETPPRGSSAGLGALNQYRLVNLRRAMSPTGEAKDAEIESFAKACDRNRLVPLARLIADDSIFRTQIGDVESVYAEAWSLVYFLHMRRREQFAAYLRTIAERDADQAFTPRDELMLFDEMLGPIDDDFERQWLRYILTRRYSRAAL